MNVASYFTRKLCTKLQNVEEIKIPVPWGHISAKWWNKNEQKTILTLHGWQDNAGTFDRLVPLLNNGVSIHARAWIFFQITTRKHFGWDKLNLMGHSLGAITSYMYTSFYPQNVNFCICIEGVKPLEKKNNAKRMGEGIDELIKYNELLGAKKEPPSYTMQQIKTLMSKASYQSVDVEQAEIILQRNLAKSKTDSNKYYFARDPRLKSRLIINWDQAVLLEAAEKVTCPLLMLKATESDYYEKKENFYQLLDVLKKSSKDCRYFYVDGKHHVHLNQPENVAGHINDFLKEHF